MNDDQLKREIEQALSVQPSPQFTARVRTRIGESRKPTWIRWGVPAAGLSLAAVVVAAVLTEPKQIASPKPVEVIRMLQDRKVESPTKNVAVPKAVPVREAVQPVASTSREPEVLFDPREVAAFQKFVEGVRDKRIDLGNLIELQQAASQTAPIEEIALMPIDDLAPIVIESLSPGPRRIEGGRL
jgi:hypothetical protein